MKIRLPNSCLYTGLLLVLVWMATGCKKDLDINQDPNYPAIDQGSPEVVFPAAVLGTIAKTGGDLEIIGGIWSQYFTQSSGAVQYTNVDAYNLLNTDPFVNEPYEIIFGDGLVNFQYVIDTAKAMKQWNVYLAATVMKAYAVSVLVDLYDKVPYFEALKGSGNLDPHFDDGYVIYQDLIRSIDSAISKDSASTSNNVFKSPADSAQDMVFSGNMVKWKQFANTLKLKLYLRMVNAYPAEAQAGITALYASGASFLTSDAAVTKFTNATGLDNPFYEQNQRALNTTTNLRASTTFASWLKANGDSRITAFFGASNAGSMNQGDYANNSTANQTAAVFVQSPTDPVELISAAESYFLQAEARVRYFGSADAPSLYNNGVLAAFAAVGQNGASYIAPSGVYEFPSTGTDDEKIEAIIVQKWASCAYGCHAIEGFFEKNRTGYPVTSPVYSDDPSYVPGQFVLSANSVLGPGLLPRRLVYPYDETSRNTNAPTTIVPITTGVWWAN